MSETTKPEALSQRWEEMAVLASKAADKLERNGQQWTSRAARERAATYRRCAEELSATLSQGAQPATQGEQE